MSKKYMIKEHNALIQPIYLVKILRGGNDAYEALVNNAGITEEYFEAALNKGDELYRDVFIYIRDYYEENHQVPLISEVMSRFEWLDIAEYGFDMDSSYDTYIQSLQYDHFQRSFISATNQMLKDASSGKLTPNELRRYAETLNQTADIVSPISYESAKDRKSLLQELFDEARESKEKKFYPIGIAGLEDLDGWEKENDYVVIAARPGEGKSMLLCKFASELLKQGKKVIFYSGEMSWQSVDNRICAASTGIHITALKNGNEAVREQYLNYLENEYANYELYYLTPQDFGRYPTARELEAICKKLEPDVLIIDQISLMRDEYNAKVYWERFANISRQIKAMRDNLNIPVLVASQLNKSNEEGTVAKLAGSDVIGQDATKVLSLKLDYDTKELNVKISKNRNGSAGKEIVYETDFGRCSFKLKGLPEADEVTKTEDNIF